MSLTVALLMTAGSAPLAVLWRRSRGSTIRHALAWAVAAWAVACLAAFADDAVGHYAALCGSACAGVAVLGARRPGAWAWHFVVLCLAAVLAMPAAWGRGEVALSTEMLLFLSGLLAVAGGNFLPTAQALPALLVAAYGVLTLLDLSGTVTPAAVRYALLVPVPWLAWLADRREPPADADALWRHFRDRFGVMWAQRVREQFARSAEHAGLGVELTWFGLEPPAPDAAAEAKRLALIKALLSRFGSH